MSFLRTDGFGFQVSGINPLPVNNDEILLEDVDWDNSEFPGWIGNPQDLLGNVNNGGIYNDSTDNPKYFIIRLKRTKLIREFGIGTSIGTFKRVKGSVLGSGDAERGIFDATDDPREKTSATYNRQQVAFNAIKFEFFTADRIDVTNLFFKNAYSTRLNDYVNKWGVNDDIDSGQTEDIWDLGDLYIFTTTAQPYFISSASATDTQDIKMELILQDVDGLYRQFITTIALQGQTKVQIPTPFNCVGVNRAFNKSGTPLTGQVYIYEDTTITGGVPDDLSFARASIKVDIEQTQMAIYRVPHYLDDGLQVLFVELTEWRCALSRNRTGVSAVGQLRIAEPNEVLRVRDADAITESFPAVGNFGIDSPVVVPPGSDVLVRVTEVSTNDCAFGAHFKLNYVTF